MTAFYEEKVFDDGPWFRTHPGGAWTKKAVPKVGRGGPFLDKLPIDRLLNEVQFRLGIARRLVVLDLLGISSGTVSRIRSGHYPISSIIVLKIYDLTDMSIEEIRELAELPNPRKAK